MIFLISLVLALVIALGLNRPLRKHPLPCYLVAAGIASAVSVCSWMGVQFPDWFSTWVWPVFSKGALGGALFVVVMVTGALPNGSKTAKQLMPVRGALSILASIFSLAHVGAYAPTYLTALFTRFSRLGLVMVIAILGSVILVLVMLPLFVTSFKMVRKQMQGRTWKRLQRLAYGFYALLYAHVLLLCVPGAIQGKPGYRLTVFVYSLVFLSYALCRVMKAVAKREKTIESLPKKQAVGLICGTVTAGLILLSVIYAGRANTAQSELEATLAAQEAHAAAALTIQAASAAAEPELPRTTPVAEPEPAQALREPTPKSEPEPESAIAEPPGSPEPEESDAPERTPELPAPEPEAAIPIQTSQASEPVPLELSEEPAILLEEAPVQIPEPVEVDEPEGPPVQESERAALPQPEPEPAYFAPESVSPDTTQTPAPTMDAAQGEVPTTAPVSAPFPEPAPAPEPDLDPGPESEPEPEIVPASVYRDGVYTGSGTGNHGTSADVVVSVTIANDQIVSIIITSFLDDELYFSPAIEGADLIGSMLSRQSPYVDAVSGATESSEALIRAVAAALAQARN